MFIDERIRAETDALGRARLIVVAYVALTAITGELLHGFGDVGVRAVHSFDSCEREHPRNAEEPRVRQTTITAEETVDSAG